MAFYQDNVSFTPSSPKLPDIGDGSIFSSTSSSSSSSKTHWPVASEWSITLRTKLEYSINYSGQPHAEDVNELCTAFIKVIIAALQPTSSKQDWLELNHILGLIAPFSKYFHATSISHYVERLVLVYAEKMEKIFDIPILESLSNAFPVETHRIQSKYGSSYSGANSAMKYFKKTVVSQIELPSPNLKNSRDQELLVLPDGRSPYLLKRKGPGDNPLKQFRAKPLSLGALSKNIAPVAEETANKESLWKEKHSTTVAAINCRFPDTCDETCDDATSEWSEATELSETYHKRAVINTKLEEFQSMTGREAVELFIQHKHLHKVKFLYLNKAPNRHYRPYDLVSVPRDHIDKEHFIFSSFGVLHVFPEESYTETLTLAGWHKDAVNWNAITKLKFFKNFLIGKFFQSWKLSVRRIKFLRTRKAIENQLLHAVPDFGSAFLHIFRLLHELSEVVFLPGKPSTVCQYTVLEYEADANRIRVDVQNVLELFFMYSKKVVDTTKRACFDQLKHYEHQAKYSRPLFVKESLYLQRRKQEIRSENLNRACERTKKIPSFITLIDQAISFHLLALARHSVTKFVNDVLFLDSIEEEFSEETFSTAAESQSTAGKGITESKDDSTLIISAVFAAKFVFNKQNYQLEMQPSVEKFRTAMLASIAKLISVMCDRTHSMHSVRVVTVTRRPGSAPTSVGSSRTEMSSEVLSDSSMSSFDSELGTLPIDLNLHSNEESKNTLNRESTKPGIIGMNTPNETGLTDPQISLEKLPNKVDDDDGIVTPDMMLKSGEKARLGLTVAGKGMIENYGVLDKFGLRERMLQDLEIANSVKVQEEMVESALKEVVEFSDENNSWLAKIRKFTSTWDEQEMEKWKGQPARNIEDLLNRIKAWTEKVKNMERSLVTQNKLLYVDCRLPNACLSPALNTIFKKLIAMTVAHAKTLSIELTNEAKEALRILKNKDTNMKSFATYARKVTESVQHKEELTKKVNYIRSLYEVVRMTYRQLSQEEEKLDEKVKSTWDAFLFQLKDATNFVSNQRPVITKQLDEIFRAHYKKALSICKQSASGYYVEPEAHSNEVIEQLSGLLREYQETLEKLSELSLYRESVCGKKYELDELFEIQQVMTARYDLWKYVNVSEYTIADWKSLLFRKFNANLALEKIHEWQHAAGALTEHLPESDPVLQHWNRMLENLARELPLLHRLSNEAIRIRHWRALFTGMGELMEPDATLTVNDLLSYKPSQFSDVIIQVYNSAIEEFSLDQILRIIKRQWEERQFHLAKHIYIVSVDKNTGDFEDESTNTWNKKDWKTGLKDQRPNTQEKDSDTFVLVGVDDLLRDLSECHVTLQGMFQSRHAVEIKAEAEIWSDTLQQLGEIVNLWVSCQDKWMYLNRVFCSDANLSARFSKYHRDFEMIDDKYREFISAMSSDPKVLSVLSRRHGQQGWRELQGENLRKHLVSITNLEEKVLHGISSLLEDYRSQFPRLYFFSDDDCVRLIGISRQPKALLPYAKKCFSGVKSLVFTLPSALGDQNNKSLDLELHSNKLEVTNVIGNHGDVIQIKRLAAQNIATSWLSSLESRIKTSVYKQLQLAIEEHLKEGTLKIVNVMEEIWELDSLYDVSNPTAHELSHWLLKYPSQVTLLANSILWFRDVRDMLNRGGQNEEHEKIKQETVYRLKQFGQVFHDNTPYVERSSLRKRLQVVLSALIVQTAHHRDILKTLEGGNVTSHLSYEWQSLLRHTVDIDYYSKTGLSKPMTSVFPQSSRFLTTAKVGNCYVEQLGHRDFYGYEFMSISSGSSTENTVQLGTVITPTTERCSLSLNLAIHLGQCATLFGENSVGKSTIISDLARAYGRQLTTVTCSDHLSDKVFKQLLCGMLETGSWLCFDHAHILPPTALSKLSQYIKQIQDSYTYLKTYQRTQYSIRGSDNCHKLKRSNSVSTLHQVYPSASKLKSHIHIGESYIDHSTKESYEDHDIHTCAFNLPRDSQFEQFRPGSLVFSGRLLKVKTGFATLMTFSTEHGKYPNVPESMKLTYRPICLIKPDQLKIIEVWLQAAGFNDVVNLSKKLDLMKKAVNGNADHISCFNSSNIMNSSTALMCTIGLPELKCIISVAMQINCKLKTLQRSRSQSQSSLSGASSPTASPSLSSVGRSSKRSEVALANVNEEIAIVNAVFYVITPKLAGDNALTKLKECLRNIFPQSNQTSVGDQDSVLAGEIEQQMIAEKLQATRDWVNKACQLHTVLQLNRTVVITGAAGAGKTTLYKILAKALNSLCNAASSKFLKQPKAHGHGYISESKLPTENIGPSSPHSVDSVHRAVPQFGLPNPGSNFFEHGKDYHRIDATVIFPNAHDAGELFGHYENTDYVWKQGLLVKMLKECTIVHKVTQKSEEKSDGMADTSLQPSTAPLHKDAISISKRLPSLKKWIIMDGDVDSAWVDHISCLLDSHQSTLLSNLDNLNFPMSTNVIFETADFSAISPAVTASCAILHCNIPDHWQQISHSWFDSAYAEYALTQNCLKIMSDLLHDLVPPTLSFLSIKNSSILKSGLTSCQEEKISSSGGVRKITSFFDILSSSLKYNSMTRELVQHSKNSEEKARFGKSYPPSTTDDAHSTTTHGSVRSRLDDSVPDGHHQMALNLFGFAFVWAYGGDLTEDDMKKFDQFARVQLKKAKQGINFPDYETVFEYFVDEEFGRFTLWEDKIDLHSKLVAQEGVSIPYTPVHQLEKYSYISSMLLKSQKSVLLMGQTGCGKTSLISNLIHAQQNLNKIIISPGLSASHFQRLIESKASLFMKQHNLGLMAHPSAIIASRVTDRHPSRFFLDDLSMAGVNNQAENSTKIQPCLELLRQIICLNGVYEHDRLLFKSLQADIAFIATATTPGSPGSGLGYCRFTLSPRLTKDFTVIHFLKPTKETILSIYHDSIQSWLEEFPAYSLARHYDLSQAIISGSYDLYNAVSTFIKPTPRQAHCIFSIHDINKIMQGLFLLTPRTRGRPKPARQQPRRPGGGRHVGRFRGNRGWGDLATGGVPPMMRTVVRLWLHECTRVFHDRLSDDNDKHWFSNSLQDILKKQFCSSKDTKLSSPTIEKVRIVKTPIPSGVTPIPGSTSISMSSTPSLENGNNMEIGNVGASDTEGTESSFESHVNIELLKIQKQEGMSTSGESMTISLNHTSDASPFRSQNETGASSVTMKDYLYDSSPSQQNNDTDNDVTTSETTTQLDDGTTTRATTAVQDDETQSGVTGYTTEMESVFGSRSESASNSRSSKSNSEKSLQERSRKPTVEFAIEDKNVIYPSSGFTVSEDETMKLDDSSSHQQLKSRPSGAKLGVTFMPGLIDDVDVSANVTGPLIPIEQVLNLGEETTSVLFSRGILDVALKRANTSEGADTYAESTEAQLSKALQICLEGFNEKQRNEVDCMDLVFFGQAVRHAARLSRILTIKKNGHALLLSSSRLTGRHSLIKLISHLIGATTYSAEPNIGHDNIRDALRKLIRRASHAAGIKNKLVVLTIDGPTAVNSDCLNDICALIRDGQCPALYTQRELASIAADMSSANVKTSNSDTNISGNKMTALEKLDYYLDQYFSRIVANLHVIVLASYPEFEGFYDVSSANKDECDNLYFHGKKELVQFYHFLRRCPDLLTRFSCIDVYQSWEHSSCQKLAHHFLKKTTERDFDMEDRMESEQERRPVSMPWNASMTVSQQLYNVSQMMAFIHLDALARIKGCVGQNADIIATVHTLKQMIQLFVGISKMIKMKEARHIKHYEKALLKIQDAEESLHGYHRNLQLLLPKLASSRATERSWKKHVENEREEYSEAKQRCSIEEENILILEKELEVLREQSKVAFDQANPMYQKAFEAIQCLDEHTLDEIKRYKKPPASVVLVVTCLCHMFNAETADWENGKSLIMQEKFFQNLEFYDKDNIPENIYCKIGEFVRKPEFLPDYVGKGSKAAMTICKWVHAIYIYAKALRQLQPKVEMQKKTEKKLYNAQVTLGTKRVRCFQIKRELDSKIQTHKNASLTVKKFEKELKHLESKIARAERLMEQMKEYVVQWREEKDQALNRIDTSIGDSTLAAGCVAYHGTLKKEQRNCSLESWIGACKNGYIDIETGSFMVAKENTTKESTNEQPVRTQSATTTSESDISWNDIEEDTHTTTTTTSDGLLSKGLLKLRESFSLIDILSTSSEQRSWHRSGIPRDDLMRCDALRIFAQSLFQGVSWSLLFDPDHQAESWLATIHSRVKSDMENDKILCITPAPAGFSRMSMMSSSRDNSSLGIMEDSGGASSSMSDQTTTEATESVAETEVTISVTATHTTRSEKVSSSKLGRVRFADEGSDLSVTSSETKNEKVSEETEEMEEQSEEQLTEHKEENEEEEVELNLEAESPPYSLSELWVCNAADSNMPELLNLASIHGARILIQQIEQNHLPLIARSLKGSASHYQPYLHPTFCLYLSTSMSLNSPFKDSCGVCSVPWQYFTVTDLSLSLGALQERLESIVLGQERTEFEAQSRLMEADIFHLEEHMEELHDNFILRVADIEGPMLADTSLPLSIQSCKKDTLLSAASLVETRAMEVNLMNKKIHLSDVAEHGRTLYSHLVHVSKLQPSIYKTTATHFIELYSKCLKSCVRGKGSSGSSGNPTNVVLKSRVVELNQKLTDEVLKCVDENMVESDALVFKTLISLHHLVAKRQLSEDEMASLTNSNLIEKSKPVQNTHHEFDSFVAPPWMEKSIWNDLIMLEQSKPVFSGICRSISTKPLRWKEYLSSKPVLLGKVPYNRLHSLTTGQKALLWRTVCPDVFSHVINDLNNTALGSSASVSHIFDVDNIFDDLSYKRPCVFFSPANEKGSFFQPAHHVREKAQTMGIEYVEISALFDSKIGDMLEDCVTNGRWLLLNNCHLASKWPNKFLQLLTILVNSDLTSDGESPNANLSLDSQEVVIRSISTSTEQVSQSSNPSTPSISSGAAEIQIRFSGIQCHANFRLFIVAHKTPDLQSILPGMIMQHSKFVAMEIPFFHRDLAKKMNKTITSGMEKTDLPSKETCIPDRGDDSKSPGSQLHNEKMRLLLQLSLLQAILLERLFFRTSSFSKQCVWNDGGLVSAWKAVIQSESPEIAQKLCGAIMLDHIPERLDLQRAGEIVRQCTSLSFDQIENQSLKNDVVSLVEGGFDLLLQSPDLMKLGLHSSADVGITKSASRQLSQNLEHISLIRSIENGNMLALNDNKLVVLSNEVFSKRSIEHLLVQLNETTKPTLNKSILSPCMSEFYAAEVKRLETVMHIAYTDLTAVLSVMRGKIEATEAMQKLLISILKNEIPVQWIEHHRSLFRFHLRLTLSSFVQKLHQRSLLLEKYMRVASFSSAEAALSPQDRNLTSISDTTTTPTPFAYNLAVFTRPDLFLQSVIFAVARSKFHDAHKYHFEKQFLTKQITVSTPNSHNPFENIYIDGLHLHRATFDEKLGLLQETRRGRSNKLPVLQLTPKKRPQYVRSTLVPNLNESKTYECPLWLDEDITPPMHCENEVITTVQLATDRDCANWITKGVSITCSLSDN